MPLAVVRVNDSPGWAGGGVRDTWLLLSLSLRRLLPIRTRIVFPVFPQVEAVIHPRFLADLLSPEQQRDPLALMEELEQEEGLSLAQVHLGGRSVPVGSLCDYV